MKRSVALADVARSAVEWAAESVVAVREGEGRDDFGTWKQWRRMVCGWHAAFAREVGDEVGFYFDDAFMFSAALWGAWHAGKTPVLLSDMQPATLEELLPTVSITAGLLPGAVATDEGDLPHDAVLPPFDMQTSHLVLFTSGSTGRPERIVKRVAQLDAEVHALQVAFGSELNVNSLQVLATVSHQHIYGLLFRVLWPLSAGRAIGTQLARYPEELLQQLRHSQECVLISSPAMLSRLPEHLAWSDIRTCLRAIFSSGGPLSSESSGHTLTVLGHSPTEVFGSSETGGIAWRRRAEHRDTWQTLPGVEMRLNGGNGLLAVRSPHLPNPQEWWETADRVESCDHGAGFVLLGRVDRIVKIAEKRVSLTAIEQGLQASKWVHEARAVLIEHSDRPTRVGAVVELSEAGWNMLLVTGRHAMGRALCSLIAERIERVALPRSWRYVVRMPMNAQGKITQDTLLALFNPMMPQPEWVSRTQTEAYARLRVVAQLRVLDGHFPHAPLIPGVAQLHWAVALARQAFDIPGIYARAEIIKFQQPILPGDNVELHLKRLDDQDAIQFAFTSHQGPHASGKLRKGA